MIIFTDGSAHPNPGPGGLGIVILDDNNKLIDCLSIQSSFKTTNNREELKAILLAIKQYGYASPTIYSDSNYCVKTINEWMYTWKQNNWRKSDNKTPENLDLILQIYKLKFVYNFSLQKVKGHSNNKWNELADALATGQITMKKAKEKYG